MFNSRNKNENPESCRRDIEVFLEVSSTTAVMSIGAATLGAAAGGGRPAPIILGAALLYSGGVGLFAMEAEYRQCKNNIKNKDADTKPEFSLKR